MITEKQAWGLLGWGLTAGFLLGWLGMIILANVLGWWT